MILRYQFGNNVWHGATWDRFHKGYKLGTKPFNSLPQTFKKLFKAKKLSAEHKSLAQSINGFMKLTLELRESHIFIFMYLINSQIPL